MTLLRKYLPRRPCTHACEKFSSVGFCGGANGVDEISMGFFNAVE